jgi:hypothetical protein
MDLLVKTEFVGFKRWLFLQGLTAFLHDLWSIVLIGLGHGKGR